jgi:FtsZ-binding cell division protein ZapB
MRSLLRCGRHTAPNSAELFTGLQFHRLTGLVEASLVAKPAVATRSVDLEPIDRLEEKVKLLVGMIDRLRAENSKASDENTRLSHELDLARTHLTEAESANSEVLSLREERNLIRSRVDEMLQQIESLNL